jgi:predicted GNAT superfamily acetyltransferase
MSDDTTKTHDYVFRNACDGSDLPGVTDDESRGWNAMTGEEAKAHALELAERHPGYLVGAYRLDEAFVAQAHEGVFVDRFGAALPGVRAVRA